MAADHVGLKARMAADCAGLKAKMDRRMETEADDDGPFPAYGGDGDKEQGGQLPSSPVVSSFTAQATLTQTTHGDATTEKGEDQRPSAHERKMARVTPDPLKTGLLSYTAVPLVTDRGAPDPSIGYSIGGEANADTNVSTEGNFGG